MVTMRQHRTPDTLGRFAELLAGHGVLGACVALQAARLLLLLAFLLDCAWDRSERILGVDQSALAGALPKDEFVIWHEDLVSWNRVRGEVVACANAEVWNGSASRKDAVLGLRRSTMKPRIKKERCWFPKSFQKGQTQLAYAALGKQQRHGDVEGLT